MTMEYKPNKNTPAMAQGMSGPTTSLIVRTAATNSTGRKAITSSVPTALLRQLP
jgi:hypothetical protein